MMKTGPVVLLRVAKQAAVHHRLTAVLSQPSPTMSRGEGTDVCNGERGVDR